MFEEIIGNNQIKELLKNMIENDTVSHSYLFIGKRRNWQKNDGNRICKRNSMSNKRKKMQL